MTMIFISLNYELIKKKLKYYLINVKAKIKNNIFIKK